MRYAAVILLMLFVGCGGHDENNNHGYGFEYDAISDSGLRLRFNPEEPVDQRTPVEVFATFFEQVQACMGTTAPPPFVIVVSEADLLEQGSGLGGYYFSNPPLILVLSLGYFKHEVVHYLLDFSTGNLDPDHVSPLFSKCI